MYLQPFLDQVRETGLLDPHTFIPCTLEEVTQIEQEIHAQLPAAYREFLLTMGQDAGAFLTGSDYSCADLLQIQRLSRSLLEVDQIADQLPADAFVFLMHQGYQFAFFRTSEGDDPPVYIYSDTEGDSEEGQPKLGKLVEHFTDFLIAELQRYEKVSRLWRST